jgi:hypothetical protein
MNPNQTKKKSNVGQSNRSNLVSPHGDNSKVGTVTLDIQPEIARGYTKKEPLKVSGFRVYVNDDKLIVEPDKGIKNVKSHRYTLESGKLNLVIKPNTQYAYFRSTIFQNFLDKLEFNRVRAIDPNGEYRVRNGTYKNSVDNYIIITDGITTLVDSSRLSAEETPTFEVRYPTLFHIVTDATFTLVQQVTIRTNEDGTKEHTFKLRELITLTDIYSMEEMLSVYSTQLKNSLDELLK